MAPLPLPPQTRLRADPSLRIRDRGRLMAGGSPLRFIRLSAAGARVVRGWLAGDPPEPSAVETRLARRLVDAGMIHPEPASGAATDDVTVVIPVKDDQEGLEVTLALLPSMPVIVVDDGSKAPIMRPDRAESGVVLRRRSSSGGPGVARSDGLAEVETPLVAFVDAGIEVTEQQVRTLCRWFADPTVLAVAPRVATTPRDDHLARYEALRSPLDLGAVASAVGHGRLVSYLPTACLVARRQAVEAAGGFDPRLRFGEDVDLIWRLLPGGQVRYDPSVVVSHPARRSLMEMARQRFGYGLAAAPLAERHGSELAPVRISGWSLGCWLALLAGRPLPAAVLAVYTAVGLSRKLSSVVPDHRIEAIQLTAKGHLRAGVSLAEASVRIWWPLSALGWLLGLRKPVACLVGAAWIRRFLAGEGSLGDRTRVWLFGVVDDVAYGCGVWAGAVGHRSLSCLAPRLVSWPVDNDDNNDNAPGVEAPSTAR